MSTTPAIHVHRQFLKSCQRFLEYPANSVERVRYGVPNLEQRQARFQARQDELKLFAPKHMFYLPYWDVSKDGKVDQRNLKSEDQLSEWLGDALCLDPSDTGSGPAHVVAVKPDPQARFIFLVSASSIAPIEMTASALKRILSYYQVMPYFPDFLYSFGPKNGEERESTNFSGFRTEKTLQSIKPVLKLPALNRSGKRYQICCTLKSTSGVDSTTGQTHGKVWWRIRSAVVYHQFDVDCGTQLWIVGDPIQGIQKLVQEHIHEKKNHREKFETPLQSFKTSLQMLLHFSQWATEDWRWRVQSAEEELQSITQSFVTISPDRFIEWDKTGMLVTQKHIDHLTETLTCIESNIAIMNRFQSFYTDLVNDPAWPQADIVAYKYAVQEFVSQLGEHLYDLSMQLKRANLALQIGKDRKDILIQHLSAQNAAKQEEYTKIMWRQQHKTGLDAVAMKVITVITLVYLPMTFVSTFFSTDVVKYQPPDDNGSRPSSVSGAGDAAVPQEQLSRLALERFFEISIPLMAVTFLCAIGWYRWETYKINKRARIYEKDVEV